MRPKPPTCTDCPAEHRGRSFVPAETPDHPRLALLGQGPGRLEAESGRPFVGPSGRKLDAWIAEVWEPHGLRREQVYVGNVVWCWLPKDRAPTAREVEFCRAAHWGPQLERLFAGRTPLVVTVGTPAHRAIYGAHAGEQHAGSLEGVEVGG